MLDDEMITGPEWHDPAFAAELWKFVADVNEGVAEPSPLDFRLACDLVGMWQGIAGLFYQARTGCSEEAAAEHIAQMILDQRSLYGSLAAKPSRHHRE